MEEKRKNINKHGLSRYIPDNIKLEIRKNAGYGCVICGMGLYEYEHVEPEFNEAIEHEPEFITLLCPNHNQRKKKGLLSTDTVKEAMKNPKTKQQGYAGELFDIGKGTPTLKFANSSFKNCRYPLLINGQAPFVFLPPEVNAGRFRMYSILYDINGNEFLTIDNNEVRWNSEGGDITLISNILTIKNKDNKVILKMEAVPPQYINIKTIDIVYEGLNIRGDMNSIIISDLKSGNMLHTYSGVNVENCLSGIDYH